VNLELKLADVYNEKGLYEKALKHYFSLIDQNKDRNIILEKIFNSYIINDNYEDAWKFYLKYHDPMVNTPPLKKKLLELMYKIGETEEIKELLDDGGKTENILIDESPLLFFKIMKMLGRKDEIDAKLEVLLNKTLKSGSAVSLRKLGEVFYKLDKADEFKERIPDDFPGKKSILYDLHQEFDEFEIKARRWKI
jgi:tetratricopeptide (TPR) repeat protein